MTKILFHCPNLIDTATLVHSAEDPNFPVENIQNEQRSIVSKSTSTTDMNIVITHGSAVLADTLIILPGSGIPQTPTITFARHTSDSWAGPDYGPVAVTWDNGIIIHRFTPNTKAFSRVRVQLSPAGIVSIGRIILCNSRTPLINFSWGFPKRKIDRSESTVSADDQFYSNLKSKIREYTFAFTCRAADVTVLETVYDDVGNSKHLAVSFDHDANPNSELYYGRLLTPLEYTQEAPDYFKVAPITFREAT